MATIKDVKGERWGLLGSVQVFWMTILGKAPP